MKNIKVLGIIFILIYAFLFFFIGVGYKSSKESELDQVILEKKELIKDLSKLLEEMKRVKNRIDKNIKEDEISKFLSNNLPEDDNISCFLNIEDRNVDLTNIVITAAMHGGQIDLFVNLHRGNKLDTTSQMKQFPLKCWNTDVARKLYLKLNK